MNRRLGASHRCVRNIAYAVTTFVGILPFAAASAATPEGPRPLPDEIAGRTQAVPGRRAQIAPVVLHMVEHVLVAPGDRVRKGQTLVELDRDEPEAEVRAKRAELDEARAALEAYLATPREELRAEARALLENARVTHAAAKDYLDRLEGPRKLGAVTERQYIDAKTARLEAETEEAAADAHLQHLLKHPVAQEAARHKAAVVCAEAELEAAEAELGHYTITATIDGVIASLDVYPGTVSRPGLAVWGEILDLNQIDVRIELSPERASGLKLGSRAEVVVDGTAGKAWPAEVVFISPAADPSSGQLPVSVRIVTADGQIPCHVPARVRFLD